MVSLATRGKESNDLKLRGKSKRLLGEIDSREKGKLDFSFFS